MALFKKLKSGAIVFVTDVNNPQKTISGYNLACPTLRINSYLQLQIDQEWKEKSSDIGDIFYQMQYELNDCKHHPAYIARDRHELIGASIRQLLGIEIRSNAKNIVSSSIY